MAHIEQREGYTFIDRRVPEPCRVCLSPDGHSAHYGKPTMECIQYLRSRIAEFEVVPDADGGHIKHAGKVWRPVTET